MATQGNGTPISVAECVMWISQINKMLYGEYLRKRELFTQYTTSELENLVVASTIWSASSSEGMVNEDLRTLLPLKSVLVQEITDRISLVNVS